MKNGLTKEEVLRRVSANAGMEAAYQGMPGKWQERFLNFCTGKGGLPITYDPFSRKYLTRKSIRKGFQGCFP